MQKKKKNVSLQRLKVPYVVQYLEDIKWISLPSQRFIGKMKATISSSMKH